MIDTNDKSTQALDLGEQPKRRGRPATGQALSNAERQKRYREAQKAQRNENMHKKVAEDLRAELTKALEEIEFLNGKNTELLEQLRKQRDQLAQRDEKPAKPRKHRDDAPLKTILAHHEKMEDRRKSGELSDLDALWRFVGATLQVIEQHGITAQESPGKQPAKK